MSAIRSISAFSRGISYFRPIARSPFSPFNAGSLYICSRRTLANIADQSPADSRSSLQYALEAKESKNTWTKAEIDSIYNTSLMELTFGAVKARTQWERLLNYMLSCLGVICRHHCIAVFMIRHQFRCAPC